MIFTVFVFKDTDKDLRREPLELHMFDPNFYYEFYETNDYFKKGKLYIPYSIENTYYKTTASDFYEKVEQEDYNVFRRNKKKRIFSRLMGIVPDVRFAEGIDDSYDMCNDTDYDWRRHFNNHYAIWEMYEYLPLTIESKEEVSPEILEYFYVENMSCSGYILKFPTDRSLKKFFRNKFTIFLFFFVLFNIYLNSNAILEILFYTITSILYPYYPNICDNFIINDFYSDWVEQKADQIVKDLDTTLYVNYIDGPRKMIYAKIQIRNGLFNELFVIDFAKATGNYKFKPLDKHLYCLIVENAKKKIVEIDEIEYEIIDKIEKGFGGNLYHWIDKYYWPWCMSRKGGNPPYFSPDQNWITHVPRDSEFPYFCEPRSDIYNKVSNNLAGGGKEFFDSLLLDYKKERPRYRCDYYLFRNRSYGNLDRGQRIYGMYYDHPNIIEYIRDIRVNGEHVYEKNINFLSMIKFEFSLPLIFKNNKLYDYLLLVRVSIINELKRYNFTKLLVNKVDLGFTRLNKEIKKIKNYIYINLILEVYNFFIELAKGIFNFFYYILDIRNLRTLPGDIYKSLRIIGNPDIIFNESAKKDGIYVKDTYKFCDKDKFFKSRIAGSEDILFGNKFEKKIGIKEISMDKYPAFYHMHPSMEEKSFNSEFGSGVKKREAYRIRLFRNYGKPLLPEQLQELREREREEKLAYAYRVMGSSVKPKLKVSQKKFMDMYNDDD